MRKLLPFILGFSILLSCGRKDTTLSRWSQGVLTDYNVLYNGQIALDDGIADLNKIYHEDIWNVLPVEPMLVYDTLLDQGALNQSILDKFSKAEEKAVEAVQRHSIMANGKEKNKKLDRAYLILGEARYYTNRFVPALESFDYGIKNFPYSKHMDALRIWRSKASLRIGNDAQAKRRLKAIIRDDDLSNKTKADAWTSLAMVYQIQDSLDQFKAGLKESIALYDKEEQGFRNEFIYNQILLSQDSISKAGKGFRNLAYNRKSPQKFRAYAYVYLSDDRLWDQDSLTDRGLSERLDVYLEDQRFQPYYATLFYAKGSITGDETWFYRAKSHSTTDLYIKRKSYESLGNLSFQKGKIAEADAFYDTILKSFGAEENLYILRLKRKKEKLQALVLADQNLKYSDSLIALWSLNKSDRLNYFREKASLLYDERNLKSDLMLESIQDDRPAEQTNQWVFDQASLVERGFRAFEMVYGPVDNVDNWKYQPATKAESKDEEMMDEEALKDVFIDAEVRGYQSSYRSDNQFKDSIGQVRDKAMFDLAVLYQDRFEDEKQAYSFFTELLTNKEYENREEILYRMVLISNEEGRFQAGLSYQNQLKVEFPKSDYLILLGLRTQEKADEDLLDEFLLSPAELYTQIYYDFEAGCYEEVIEQVDEKRAQIQNTQIFIKFDLLYHLSLYHVSEDFMKSEFLDRFIKKYPDSKEAEMIKELINQ